MFRYFAAALLALAATHASADQLTGSSSDSARLGNKVISRGDSRARVIDAGGEPLYDNGATMIYRTGNNRHTVIRFDAQGKVISARDVIGQLSDK